MVVNELTEQQQETAARTSYAYFLWTKASDSSCTANAPSSDKPPDDDAEIRIRMAMREARRHLVGSQGDYDTAVLKLKNTIKWREVRAMLDGDGLIVYFSLDRTQIPFALRRFELTRFGRASARMKRICRRRMLNLQLVVDRTS
jgi:hypothetical protein